MRLSVLSIAVCLVTAHANAVCLALEPDPDAPIKLPANLIRVPLVRQCTNYTCGVAAVQSVLGFYGEDNKEMELARKLGANNKIGTAYRRIERLAKERGYAVEIKRDMKLDDLKELIDKKLPTICLVQAWPERQVDYSQDWQDGHYVVAVGYDDKNIFLMDPSTLGNYAYVPVQEFVQRWHDTDGKERLFQFGMVLSKKTATINADVARKMN